MFDDDRRTAQSFKVDSEGRLIFYPYGLLGKGRIVSDRATATALYARQKLLFQVAVGAAVALAGAYKSIGPAWVAALTAALCVVMWLFQYPLIRGLPISDERHDFGESINGDSRPRMWLLIGSFLFVLGGVFILLLGKEEDRWPALACIAFFGACFALFLWQTLSRSRQRMPAAEPEPVQRIRRPRDTVVVTRNPQGFGKRKTPPGS